MAFSTRNGRTQTALAEINVTPLVDVMLVLLVIFMVTAPILQSGIQVNLPKTREAQAKEATPDVLIISVDKEGAIYLSGQDEQKAINVNDLQKLLGERLAQSKERRVYLRGDGETPYRVIAYVLDQAKRVQANVSLVTEPTAKK
ncbi:MAG: biopolymer transporter ExbD [Acidobacteria bacterium]|nr:biopolymer transporter ExbD [Acidobacteriota bacterium]MBI3426783.1 biopolymer transporter ExbD [Acidobacteriota bacterium]